MLQAHVDVAVDGSVIDLGGALFDNDEQTVVMNGRANLTVRNFTLRFMTDGSSVPRWDGKGGTGEKVRAGFVCNDCSGVTFEDFTIESVNTAGKYDAARELQAGVKIVGGARNTVRNGTIRAVYGDCVSVGGGAQLTEIENVTCDLIGRQGIAVTDATATTIRHTTFEVVARSGIDVEPIRSIGHSVTGVTVVDSTFVGPIGNAIFGHSGSGDVVGTTFANNTVLVHDPSFKIGASQSAYDGGAVRADVVFTGNYIPNPACGNPLITAQNMTNLTVTGNTFGIPQVGVEPVVITNVAGAVVVSGNTTNVGSCAGAGW